MLEVIVFAIALVVANVAASLIMMKVVMSKRFMKKYLRMIENIALAGFDDEE